MEALKALSTTTKNTIVVEFFPGLVATWPILLYGLKWYRDSGKIELGLQESSLSNWEFIVSLLVLISLYGIGHTIGKLGARLEVFLDKMVITKNIAYIKQLENCIEKGEIKEEIREKYFDDLKFTSVWYQYLRIAFKDNYMPTLVRYYSGFINAFKFELNMLCALIIMTISLSIVENDGWLRRLFIDCTIKNSSMSINLLSPTTYSILTLVTLGMIAYFLYESIMAIYEQHNLRVQFIKADQTLNNH